MKDDQERSILRSKMRVEDIGLKIIDDRPMPLRKICHGDPERSLWMGGHPLPLCSRCLFFYPALVLSIPLGILILVFLDPPVITMLFFTIIMLSPLILDGMTQFHGFRTSNNVLRAVTGSLAGIGSGIATPYVLWSFIRIFFGG